MAWISSIKNIALIDDTLNFISAIWVTSTTASITNWEFMSHFILCMHPFMLFSLSILKNHAMVKVTVFLRYFPTVKLLFRLPLLLPLFPSFRKSRQTDTEICPMMIFLSWLMTGEALSAPAKSHKPLRPAFYMFNYHCAHFDILFTLGSLTDVKLMIWAL